VRARRRLGFVAAAAAVLVFSFTPPSARAAASDVETAVGETQVVQGDPVRLRIRLRGPEASSEPDLRPLAPDFEVLDSQRSRHTSIVHGVRDESVDWVIELFPRRAGELVIPALPVGAASTEPQRISVSARPADPVASEERAAPAEPVVLESSVDRMDPYEHERVVLRIALYAEGDVLEGALGAPDVPGAIVEPLGEDRRIEKELGGKRYRGIERTYTIVPEASGDFVVPSIRFEGRVRAPVSERARRPRGAFGRSFFDDFFSHGRPDDDDLLAGFFGSETRRVALGSKPVTLRVRPRPDSVTGQWWLPAREVSLSERWEPDAAPVRVGEPLTRRIELRADGASPAQLPALAAGDVAGVKQYAEAPKVTETVTGTVRIDETTLIPTQPGSVTLPAVELDWWDTQADAPRKAVLPARTVEVLPALAAGDGPSARAAAAEAAPVSGQAPLPAEPAGTPTAPAWNARGVAALVAAAALAAFLAGVAISRLRRGRVPFAGTGSHTSLRSAERALRGACQRHDVVGAEAALRILARVLDPNGTPVGGALAFASRLDARELTRQIAALAAVRYSTREKAWDGAPLWKAWRRSRRTRQRPVALAAPALPPLYPTPRS